MAEQQPPRTFNHSGWTFSRLPRRGAVRIANPTSNIDIIVAPETWASIVASMSDGGETHTNWRAALAFHQDAHSHGEPTRIREARLQVVAAVDAWEEARRTLVAASASNDGSLLAHVARCRAVVECYEVEECLLSLRALLAGLEAEDAARRSQPRAEGQEGADQADPADEQPRSGGDTSPGAAHSTPLADVLAAKQAIADLQPYAAHGPAQTPGRAVTAANAIDMANAAPGTYVAPAGTTLADIPAAYVAPTGTTLTLASLSGIAPAQLDHLAKLARGFDPAHLEGWFTRNGLNYAARWDNTKQLWHLAWYQATDLYNAEGKFKLDALAGLAKAVLHRHGHVSRPGEAL